MRFRVEVLLFVAIIASILNFGDSAQPTGCSYDDTDSVGIYTCDFTSITLPLSYSAFSPAPQRLKITKISGTLPAAGTFSGFSSYSTASLDKNYAASLELQCSTSSSVSLTISATTFADMSYVQSLTITNCNTADFPASVFSDFGQLDSLVITGGVITAYDANMFQSLDITPASLIPVPSGRLEISNLQMPATTLTTGVFTSLVNVTQIKLENIGLTAVIASDFSSNTALHQLDLSSNQFTTLADGFFTGIDGLSVVDFSNINWDCSCTNLWFLSFFETNGIEMVGGAVCGTPTTHANKKAEIYYSETCVTVDPCNGSPGIVAGTSCIAIWDLVAYIILVIALVFSCVALGLICHTRKQLLTAKNKLANKKNTSWNKVQEAMKRRGGAGQKPPAATSQPNKGKGWV